MPYDLKNDSPDKTGRNTGVFWYQSSVGTVTIRDGTSSTAMASERCLGVPPHPDLLADYYLTAPSIPACSRATPRLTPRYINPVEWSGGCWVTAICFTLVTIVSSHPISQVAISARMTGTDR